MGAAQRRRQRRQQQRRKRQGNEGQAGVKESRQGRGRVRQCWGC